MSFSCVEPKTVNKGASWEATQYFQGSLHLFLIYFSFKYFYFSYFLIFIFHTLGTMYELSVGGCIMHLIES